MIVEIYIKKDNGTELTIRNMIDEKSLQYCRLGPSLIVTRELHNMSQSMIDKLYAHQQSK